MQNKWPGSPSTKTILSLVRAMTVGSPFRACRRDDSDAVRQAVLEAADRVGFLRAEGVDEAGERLHVVEVDPDAARGSLRHPAGRAVIGDLAIDQLDVLRQRSAALREDGDLRKGAHAALLVEMTRVESAREPMRPMNWITARASGRGRSKRCQAQSSLPVNAESLIHFTRPMLTISQAREIRNRLPRVDPTCVDQQPSRRLVGEIDDDRVQDVPTPRRDWL